MSNNNRIGGLLLLLAMVCIPVGTYVMAGLGEALVVLGIGLFILGIVASSSPPPDNPHDP